MFETKNLNLGKFWKYLQWKVLVYLTYGHLFYILYVNLVYFVAIRNSLVIWYIVSSFGLLVYCSKNNLATLDLSGGVAPSDVHLKRRDPIS
jgi:hypothetical protein